MQIASDVLPTRRSPCGERGLKSTSCRIFRASVASLPVRGAWIEILCAASASVNPPSLPVRGAWIEMGCAYNVGIRPPSLPVRGAWIEMGKKQTKIIRPPVSLPVRGAWIEMPHCRRTQSASPSLPVRGAWIEICPHWYQATCSRSLPVRGAWIEIIFFRFFCKSGAGRSPCGERGLKFCRGCQLACPGFVAPRAGSVD